MRHSSRIHLFLFLVIIIFSGGCTMAGKMMIHEQQSSFDFDKTVETITRNAMELGWSVPKTYDFQATLLKHKQPDPGRIKVVKICQPEYASNLFANDDSKFVSAMMPCSISIYEKSDGKTYVSFMNMGLMAKMFSGNISTTLAQVAADDKKILDFLGQ